MKLCKCELCLGHCWSNDADTIIIRSASLLRVRCQVSSDSANRSVSRLFATPWTAARQAPLSMGCSTQEYWLGLPCPPPWDLPDSGIESRSPALQTDSLRSEPLGVMCQVPGKGMIKIIQTQVLLSGCTESACWTGCSGSTNKGVPPG